MSSVASAGHLNDIFARALRSALPPHIAQDILQRVVSERRLSIPSAPSVSRHRLTLHLAFLLHVRQVNEQMLDCTTGPPARYHTADASPQGGREWFLSGALLIPAASLAKAFAVATTLCLEPCSPAAVEAATFLESAISRRACCPVALGSARASVCHKMHAQLHALRLEHASWDSVAAAVRSSVSWLTDFGTESGLCEVPPFHVSDLFPWHFHFSSVTSNIDDQINAPDAPIAVDPVPCEFAFEACEGGEADDAMEFDWRSDADTGVQARPLTLRSLLLLMNNLSLTGAHRSRSWDCCTSCTTLRRSWEQSWTMRRSSLMVLRVCVTCSAASGANNVCR